MVELKSPPLFFLLLPIQRFARVAVNQDYAVDVFRATVINGNDALLKCDVPSFVSDFVSVDGWVDSEGDTFMAGIGFDSN